MQVSDLAAEALQLKADALAAQEDRDGAHAARREAEALNRRLIPPDLDLEWCASSRS